MRSPLHRFGLLLLALLMLPMGSCPLEPLIDHDAGSEAFVRRLVPLMWGRRPYDLAELSALVAVAEQTDRATLVRSMARTDAFVERWNEWLYDALAVNRAGDRANTFCYNVGNLPVEDPAIRLGGLAAHVRDQGPGGAPWAEPFTMRDLTRSALWLDDLSPIYRANLFPPMPTEMKPPNLLEAQSQRRNYREIFEATYLHRQHGCLECHNSQRSTTDAEEPELDRTWQVPGYLEAALFGDSEGLADPDELAVFFRRQGVVAGFRFGDQDPAPPRDALFLGGPGCEEQRGVPGCEGCGCEEEVCSIDNYCCEVEWDANCVNLCATSRESCVELPEDYDGCTDIWPLVTGCDGCACEERVCQEDPGCCEYGWTEECSAMCRGFTEGPCGEVIEPDPTLFRPWGLDFACGDFLPPESVEPETVGQQGWFVQDWGDNASVYDLERILDAGFVRLREEGLSVADDLSVAGPSAMAWLVSLNIADQVWAEAFGERLTISHSFPRNEYQREILADLAQGLTVSGYSLSELLVEVATHPLFNQRVPARLGPTAPYYLPPVVNPWSVEADAPNERDNSLGDLVHLRRPRVLVRATSAALGWTQPDEFVAGVDNDPSTQIYSELGAFIADAEPGFTGVSFQGLLAWEDHYGSCSDPLALPLIPGCTVRDEPDCPDCSCRPAVCGDLPHCCIEQWDAECVERCRVEDGCLDVFGWEDGRRDDYTPPADFVDELVTAAQAGSATWAEAVAVLKERLLTDPQLEAAEVGLIEELLGQPLDSALPAGEAAQEGLRRVCAALLASPDFLLAHVPAGDRLAEQAELVPFHIPGASPEERCQQLSADFAQVVTLRCGPEGVLSVE